MLLKEYGGKRILREYGIPAPEGYIVENEQQLLWALANVPAPYVLKAQVATGGRGKSGGIQFADSREQALDAFRRLMKSTINDHQVLALLVEQKMVILRERYVGVLFHENGICVMLGRDGGVEVEQAAAADPNSVVLVALCFDDVSDFHRSLTQAFEKLQFPRNLWSAYIDVIMRLETLFRDTDCILAEINPLAELYDGSLMALDARIDIDDSALGRQTHIRAMMELCTADEHANHIGGKSRLYRSPEGGEIALIGYGGGMMTCVSDWIQSEGYRLGATVDMDFVIDTGQPEDSLSRMFDELSQDKAIQVILISIITSGRMADDIARIVVASLRARIKNNWIAPVVLFIQGKGGEEATRIIENAGFKNSAGIQEAIDAAISLVKK